MMPLTVGVVREGATGEGRVAIVPPDVGRLTAAGMAVVVETGAGAGAYFADEAYAEAGAEIVPAEGLAERSDIITCIGAPTDDALRRLRAGQVVVGLLGATASPERMGALADRGVTAVSFDALPRTASRAQSMDALTSQANIAGYKAVLVAATAFGRLMPMLVTAAGTSRPARVLILGAGIAGLQAIGTARRLGAVVSAYDVRPAAREEVASLGAAFVELGTAFGGAGEGGYARALSVDEQQGLTEALEPHVARADIVITTAQVPGRTPPLLVNDAAVKAMSAGSVVVDLAAGPYGGNVATSRADRQVITENGVLIIGAANLPATVPTAASAAYSRNTTALLRHLVHDGRLDLEPTDEIRSAVVVIRDGHPTHPPAKGNPQ